MSAGAGCAGADGAGGGGSGGGGNALASGAGIVAHPSFTAAVAAAVAAGTLPGAGNSGAAGVAAATNGSGVGGTEGGAADCGWERLLESQSEYIANLQRMLQSACHNASSLNEVPAPPASMATVGMANAMVPSGVGVGQPNAAGTAWSATSPAAAAGGSAEAPRLTPVASPLQMQPPVPPSAVAGPAPVPPVPPPAKQAWPLQSQPLPADEGAGGCAIERLAATAAAQRDERANPLGNQQRQQDPLLASQQRQPDPLLCGQQRQPDSLLASQQRQPDPLIGSQQRQPDPLLCSQQRQPDPLLGSQQRQADPLLGMQQRQVDPLLGSQRQQDSLLGSYRSGVAASSTSGSHVSPTGSQPRADPLLGSFRHVIVGGSNAGSHIAPTGGLAATGGPSTSPRGAGPCSCVSGGGGGAGAVVLPGGGGGGSGAGIGGSSCTGGLGYNSGNAGPCAGGSPNSNATLSAAFSGPACGHESAQGSFPGSAALPAGGSVHSPVATAQTLALTSTALAASAVPGAGASALSRAPAQTPPPPGPPPVLSETSGSSSVPVAPGATAGGTVGVTAQYEQTANEVLRLRLLKSQHEEIRQQLIRVEGQLRRLPPHAVFQFRAYLERNLRDYSLASQVQQPIIRLLECLCVVCKIDVTGLTPEALLSSARKLLRDTHNFTTKLSSTPHLSGEEVKGLAPFLLAGAQYRRVREKEVNDCYEAFHAWLSAFYIFSSVSDQIAPTAEALSAQEWLLRRLNGQVVEQQPLRNAAPALVPPVGARTPAPPSASAAAAAAAAAAGPNAVASPSAPQRAQLATGGSCTSGGTTTRPSVGGGGSGHGGHGHGDSQGPPGGRIGGASGHSRIPRSSGLTSPGSRGRPGIVPTSPSAPRASPLHSRPRADTAGAHPPSADRAGGIHVGGMYSSRSPSPGACVSALRLSGGLPLRGGGGGVAGIAGGTGSAGGPGSTSAPAAGAAAASSAAAVSAAGRRNSIGNDASHVDPVAGVGLGTTSKASSPGLTRVQSEKVLHARSPRATGATSSSGCAAGGAAAGSERGVGHGHSHGGGSGHALGSRSPSPTSGGQAGTAGIGTGRAMSPVPAMSQCARPFGGAAAHARSERRANTGSGGAGGGAAASSAHSQQQPDGPQHHHQPRRMVSAPSGSSAETAARVTVRVKSNAASAGHTKLRLSAPQAGRSGGRQGGRLNSPGPPRGTEHETAAGSGKTPRGGGGSGAADPGGPNSGARERERPGAVPEVHEEDLSDGLQDDDDDDLGYGPHRRRLSAKQYEALVRCAQQVVALSSVQP